MLFIGLGHMNYTIENIDLSTKKLLFDFNSEEIKAFDFESRIHSSLKEKQKNIALKGFRKGKVPLDMIEKVYGRETERNIFQDFMFEQIGNAVEKESWEVIRVLPLENLQYQKGELLSFNVALEIIPCVELKDISGYVFTKGEPSATDQEFDDFIKRAWLLPHSETREVTDEGAVLEGERYGVLDFEGKREDGTVELSESEYWNGQKDFLGFRDNIVGMKKGEKKSFELVMSDDYSEEHLRGVKLFFDVKLLEIKEHILPELNDEFAKKEGGFESADEMRKVLREKMLESKRQEVEEKLRYDIEERLLEDNPFDVPDQLIKQREEEAKENIRISFSNRGYPRKKIKPYLEVNKEDIRKKVLRSTKLSLIFRVLVKKYGIEISEEESNRSVEDKIFKKILENVTVRHKEVLP